MTYDEGCKAKLARDVAAFFASPETSCAALSRAWQALIAFAAVLFKVNPATQARLACDIYKAICVAWDHTRGTLYDADDMRDPRERLIVAGHGALLDVISGRAPIDEEDEPTIDETPVVLRKLL